MRGRPQEGAEREGNEAIPDRETGTGPRAQRRPAVTDHCSPFWPAGRRGRLRQLCLHNSKGTAVSSQDRGLLARLDTLVELVTDRHGLALLPDSRLAAAEARVAAQAAELAAPRGNRSRRLAPAPPQREAVELLRAEGVGLLRVRGDRLEATSLRHAWAQIDATPPRWPNLRCLVPSGSLAGVPAPARSGREASCVRSSSVGGGRRRVS
jgi:hypothetical protein